MADHAAPRTSGPSWLAADCLQSTVSSSRGDLVQGCRCASAIWITRLVLFWISFALAQFAEATDVSPKVRLTAPGPGQVVQAPGPIPIQAEATPQTGLISKVEFYSGSVKIAESTLPPYEAVWSDVAPGNYWLTAIATDAQGTFLISVPVEIAVVSPTCGSAPGSPPTKGVLPSPGNNPLQVYFGQDLSPYRPFGPNQVARPTDIPESRRAAAAFQARLPGVVAETFEEFPLGTIPSQIAFGTNTVHLSGDQIVNEVPDPSATINGEFPTSGTRALELLGSDGSGFFALEFTTPQAAFGFYATDIELNGLNITLTRPDGSFQQLDVPVTVPQGSAGTIFYGVIDTVRPFIKVQLSRVGALEDSFFFDDLIIATQAQLLPEKDFPRVSVADAAPVTLSGAAPGRALFALQLSKALSIPAAVEYFTADGTAQDGIQYVGTNGLVRFEPGQTMATVSIDLLGTTNGPAHTTFTVQLRNPSNIGLARCEAEGAILRVDNTPPTISTEPDQQTYQNTPTALVPFTIADRETPVDQLLVTARSSNPLLVTQEGIALAGSGSIRTIALTPALGQLGSSTITITVTDGNGASAATSFVLRVAPRVNRPPTIRIIQPGNRTIFDLGQPIQIQAEADDPDGSVVTIELYAGSMKIGSTNVKPYLFTWGDAAEGDYVLTATAADNDGAVTVSDPVQIAVSDVCGGAAIVRNVADPEFDQLQEYLYELGIRSSIFDRATASQTNLASFDLIIWDDAGRDGLGDAEVRLFENLFISGKPLYFIGDRLVSSLATLSADLSAQWTTLINVQPSTAASLDTQVQIARDQSGAISVGTVVKDGKVGTVADFSYPFFTTNATAQIGGSDTVTVLGQAGTSDVLVATQSPGEGGGARRLTQLFRVANGGDEASRAERKRLFQNAVWWLLNCKLCSNLNLHPDGSSSPTAPMAGGTLTYNIAVDVAGGCEALGVVLTSTLPVGTEFVSAESRRGNWSQFQGVVTFNLGRLTRDSAAPEPLQIVVRLIDSGLLTNRCSLRSLNETGGSLADNQFEIVSEVATGLRLNILKSAPGTVEIKIDGPAGASCTIESSDGTGTWLPIENLQLQTGTNQFPDSVTPTARQRLFRGVLK